MATQLQIAKSGEISEQVKFVAKAENVDVSLLAEKVAKGHVVIPANKIHLQNNLMPKGIGRILSTKVNANIGVSSARSTVEKEIAKTNVAIEAGADAIMDLSTGRNLDKIREQLIDNCQLPFGTVPIYQVIEEKSLEEITHKAIMEVIEKQAKQGVDFFTIHAGLLREHLPLLKNRVAGIVSRGGALLAKWMLYHDMQNPMYELFDEICDILLEYDVSFSLGDGLRPGAGADATDQAQLAELKTLGELTQRAQQKGCQVFVEGPGHVPFSQIQYNMTLQNEICNGAPFYVLGPVVTDIAPGYDHITAAIGGTAAAYYGASFLCYVTPREHLGLPNVDDVRKGVVATKIAAHAADVARGLESAVARDKRLSIARANLDWENHLKESLDPGTAERMRREACTEIEAKKFDDADYCTMCGREWCSVRINREIRDAIKEDKV